MRRLANTEDKLTEDKLTEDKLTEDNADIKKSKEKTHVQDTTAASSD
jgi:hypothetical protein